jgi:hypothetical protein
MIELIWFLSFSIKDAHDDATAAAAVPVHRFLMTLQKCMNLHRIATSKNATL